MSDSPNISILACFKDSPALVHSGYAKISQYTTPYLINAGYNTRLHAPVGHSHGVLFWKEPHSGVEFEIWTGGDGMYGESIIPSHMQKLRQDSGKSPLFIFCGDTIALDRIPQWSKNRDIAAVAWGAVDWEWPTPRWALEKHAAFLKVWPMSRWGQDTLARDGLKNLGQALWCGVNPEIWKPEDRGKFPLLMDSMGFREDTFNVFSAFANQHLRKGEYEMLVALGEFHKKHPEAKIRFFGFTQVRREWDFAALADHLGISDIVRWSDDYSHVMGLYPEEDVAAMMNCSDVVVSLGYEGFGLQTIEAQSLERPVIGLNAAATPELLHSGVVVPTNHEFMHTNMIRRLLPNGPKVVEALETVYQAKLDGKRWRSGRRWVLENCTWEKTGRGLVARVREVEQALADESAYGPPPPGPLAVERSKEQVVIQ